MEISRLPHTMPATGLPLEQLAQNSKLSETEKIGELSRQFEAVLLRQILGQAQKTVIQSGPAENSAISGIYQDMISAQLADSISKTGSFGLAKSLQAELTRQWVKPKTKETP